MMLMRPWSCACVLGLSFMLTAWALPVEPLCNIDPPNQCKWYQESLSFQDRRDALLAAMTTEEKLTILDQGGVARLHVVSVLCIPAWHCRPFTSTAMQDGFNEALHGVAWSGRATVFPCPMAMAGLTRTPKPETRSLTLTLPFTSVSIPPTATARPIVGLHPNADPVSWQLLTTPHWSTRLARLWRSRHLQPLKLRLSHHSLSQCQ